MTDNDAMNRIDFSRALVATTVLAGLAIAPAQQAPEARGDQSRRLVRKFDFEDVVVPDIMPLPFYRHVEVSAGFPAIPIEPFSYDDTHAHGGSWSFKFELERGSLFVRIPTFVVNVLPLTDYQVSVFVRTEQLEHARARLMAWFHDANGDTIDGSETLSQAVHTRGRWTRLEITLPGKHADAVGLVVGLQLVQPDQLGEPGDGPPLEDVTGSAWFDDIVVWQVPRTQLDTTADHGVVRLPAPVEFDLLVRDSTSEALTAQLEVNDLEGQLVAEQGFSAPRGRRPRRVRLDALPPGWYQANLGIHGGDQLAGEQHLTFCVIPQRGRPQRAPTDRFMVVVPEGQPESFVPVPTLVRQLGVAGVVLPVWHPGTAFAHAELSNDDQIRCIEALLNRRIGVVFALNGVPYDVSRRAGLDADQVVELLTNDPALWRSALDELLTRYGLEVERWQIGRVGGTDFVTDPMLDGRLRRFRDVLDESVPEPRLLVPMGAHESLDRAINTVSAHVSVPNEIAPASIAEYVEPWIERGADTIVTLETLPADEWAPRERAIDLMLRTLHTWRAETPHVAIHAPWEVRGDVVSIDPLFVTWRVLADELDGRRFGGEFDLHPDVHCWILGGANESDTAIVAWTDRVSPTATVDVRTLLGSDDLTVIDAQGRSTVVRAEDGAHHLTIGNAPVFIEGVSLSLARFRERFAIEPARVESTHRMHEAELVVRNPWNQGISGTIHLENSDRWRLAPRVIPFDIPPGATSRLPVQIRFSAGTNSGRLAIPAEITIRADRDYQVSSDIWLTLGIPSVTLNASWRLARNVQTGVVDLIVTLTVNNDSESTLELDLYLLASGIQRERRSLTALPPGSSGTRTIRIDDGARLLAGKTVRIGASDRAGAGRINQTFTLPTALDELAGELANVSP